MTSPSPEIPEIFLSRQGDDSCLGMEEVFDDYLCRTPDMQAETGQPIYFWNRLLNAVVLQKTDFDFVHDVSRTKQNSVKL